MKNTQKAITLLVTMIIAVVFVLGNSANAQQAKAKPWPVPDKDKMIKAPVKLTDASVIANGKDLWAKNCKSCHGSKGMGDGPKGASLKTFPGDFSSATFQGMTDGELFYKTSTGRDEMPSYGKKLPEASDRWALVAFMRTLKK
ncbi:MAG: cytochrome c [Bacteroidales bacterium]|jgi:mono/diheme cytochrome c family protein